MKAKTIGYWVTTVLAAPLFAVPGAGLLARMPHFTEEMAHLGYPLYFLTFLGVWKVLGALAILVPRLPRLKEWAYAGMIFDCTGAAASRAASGDGLGVVIGLFAIAGLVVASWALRPEGRVLNSPRRP